MLTNFCLERQKESDHSEDLNRDGRFFWCTRATVSHYNSCLRVSYKINLTISMYSI
jgi:hypothetical protein